MVYCNCYCTVSGDLIPPGLQLDTVKLRSLVSWKVLRLWDTVCL